MGAPFILSKGGDSVEQPVARAAATAAKASRATRGGLFSGRVIGERLSRRAATISENGGVVLARLDGVSALKIKKIDHVAVCVADLDQAAERWGRAFGLQPASRELVASQQTEAMLLPVGETSVELIAPRGNEGLARFLEKRGPGLHHVAIEVE